MQLINSLSYKTTKKQKTFFLFLLAWFLLNTVQALFTGLHADEAYYWLYTQFLNWGYFDHPPMVAIFIKAGSFVNNTLGLRLFTCLTNALSVYLLWLILKKYQVHVWVFITLFSSVLLFHIYGFITTPDAPLFFFSVLFLYLYQQYVLKNNLAISILLGLVAAALLYSKYHGILLLFFVLISNLNLFKRPSLYILITVALIAFAPHVYWQYQNNYPSLQYHLFDRSAELYQINFTAQYLLDFFLMCGPLTGWLLIYNSIKQKTNADIFLRSLKFILFGIFIFFFLSTFKGHVQAHWPLIGFIPMLILASISLSKNQVLWQKNWVKTLFTVNISLIILCRILIIVPPKAFNKIEFISNFNSYGIWANQIKSYTKNYPVIFLDGFQDPSLFNYYTKSTKGFDYDSYSYRKTQFEIFPLEDSIRNHKAYFIDTKSHKTHSQDTLKTVKSIYYGLWLDSVRMYQKVNFTPLNQAEQWQKNETKTIFFKIENPYSQNISFTNNGQKYKCSLKYAVQKNSEIYSVQNLNSNFNNLKIPLKSFKNLALKITAPSKVGNYKYFIILQTAPFAGSRNSAMLKMNVN